MLSVIALLAEVLPAADLNPDLKAAVKVAPDSELRDLIIVVAVALVLAAGLFAVVYLTRRNRRTRSDGGRVIYRAEKKSLDEDSPKSRHRKKRRRKEEFGQRNPTLGETGGLPPLRTEEPVEPAS
jgi:hypothetical protein